MAVGVRVVVGSASAHEGAQMCLVHLIAHGQHVHLDAGTAHLLHSFLDLNVVDALGATIREHQKLLLPVPAAPEAFDGERESVRHLRTCILELGFCDLSGHLGGVPGKFGLQIGVVAVLADADTNLDALPFGGQEALSEHSCEVFGHLEVLGANAGRAVHHDENVCVTTKRNWKRGR